MNFPSVKTIQNGIGIDRATARVVRGLMDGTISPDEERFAHTAEWVSRCYHMPRLHERVMSAINETIRGSGVEALELEPGSFANCDRNAEYWDYVNLGDTYKTTVMRHSRTGKFRVCCWGDIAERIYA